MADVELVVAAALLGVERRRPFVGVDLARVGAEGRGLDDLLAEEDVRQAEAASDDAAVAEQRLDLGRRGAGGDIEIFGTAAEQQIAHATADEICGKSAASESADDFCGVGIDLILRDRHER